MHINPSIKYWSVTDEKQRFIQLWPELKVNEDVADQGRLITVMPMGSGSSCLVDNLTEYVQYALVAPGPLAP